MRAPTQNELKKKWVVSYIYEYFPAKLSAMPTAKLIPSQYGWFTVTYNH